MKTFTDSRDGKTYKTIKIGSQIWMAENLAFKASSGCWAYDDDKSNVEKHGYLYDWNAAKTTCPAGWHVPSDEEWEEVGKAKDLIKKLSLLLGGYSSSGSFYVVDYCGYWWTASESGMNAWRRRLHYTRAQVYRSASDKAYGFSVRCVQDTND
jgi:hypothetical protein